MNSFYSFIVSSAAGLATMIGAFIVLCIKKRNDIIICVALAFSATVMIIISLFDLFPASYSYINNLGIIIFFIGMGFIIGIITDKCFSKQNSADTKLYRIGIITTIALVIHNIPEGIVTFLTSNNDLSLGISLSFAIAMHNIPEGIATALPFYYATKNRIKTYLLVFIAAISEPIGAIIAYLFLAKYINNLLLGVLFSFTVGIMMYISMFELLKTSFEYKKYKYSLLGIIIGIIMGFIPIIIK